MFTSLLKAGTARYKSTGNSAGCKDCDSGNCPDTLATPMPWTVNIHEWPSVRAIASNHFNPANNSVQRACVQADETVKVNAGTPTEFSTVPVGYVMPLAYVPPVSIVEGVSFGASYEILSKDASFTEVPTALTPVGESMLGLTIAIKAYEYNPCDCEEISDVTTLTEITTAVPTDLASIDVHELAISCTKGVIGKPSPATGGYVANEHGVLYVAEVLAAPTNVSLSAIRGAFGLQVNAQTSETTPRLYNGLNGSFGVGV